MQNSSACLHLRAGQEEENNASKICCIIPGTQKLLEICLQLVYKAGLQSGTGQVKANLSSGPDSKI